MSTFFFSFYSKYSSLLFQNNEYIDLSETNEDYESSNDMDILNPGKC